MQWIQFRLHQKVKKFQVVIFIDNHGLQAYKMASWYLVFLLLEYYAKLILQDINYLIQRLCYNLISDTVSL